MLPDFEIKPQPKINAHQGFEKCMLPDFEIKPQRCLRPILYRFRMYVT